MSLCVPIKDLRDTAAFDEMVSTSSDFSRWEQAEARARLLERIMVSERERAEGKSVDAFEATKSLREKYGL